MRPRFSPGAAIPNRPMTVAEIANQHEKQAEPVMMEELGSGEIKSKSRYSLWEERGVYPTLETRVRASKCPAVQE